MRQKFTFFTLILITLLFTNIFAQDYGASVKVSTLGITLEGMRSFGPSFNTRLGASFFNYSHDGGGGDEDYEYSGDLSLFSISALADYFIFGGNTFRITGGILINLNEVDGNASPAKTYEVGGDFYTPELLGDLDVQVEFNKISPYLGIGFGNPLSGDSGLKFSLDIGTIYQGAPNVDLTAVGLLEPSASPDQEKQIEENIDWFQWYPVLTFGLTYKF